MFEPSIDFCFNVIVFVCAVNVTFLVVFLANVNVNVAVLFAVPLVPDVNDGVAVNVTVGVESHVNDVCERVTEHESRLG
jgi:hypothetical protein